MKLKAAAIILTGLIIISTLNASLFVSALNSTNVAILSSGYIIQDTSSDKTEGSYLQTEGKKIIDSQGNEVILKGAALISKYNTEDFYSKAASWGFNSIRLSIYWQYIEPEPGIYDDNYLNTILNNDVVWAEKYGLYIILDMHQWSWSPHFTYFGGTGNGMPKWLVGAYEDSAQGLGYAITDFWMGKGPNGTTATANNPSMQERFVATWEIVAEHFKNEPNVIYELFNEPYRSDYYYLDTTAGLDFYETAAYLYQLYDELIPAIRVIDPEPIIIYQPVSGWHIPSAKQLFYPNLIFGFHCYDYANDYNGDRAVMERGFYAKYMNYPKNSPLKEWEQPLFLGEFSCGAELPTHGEWIHDMLSICNDYNLSWNWWYMSKSTALNNSALFDGDGNEKIELTEHLIQLLNLPKDLLHVSTGVIYNSTNGNVQVTKVDGTPIPKSPSNYYILYIGETYSFTFTPTNIGKFIKWDIGLGNYVWGTQNPLIVEIDNSFWDNNIYAFTTQK